MLETLLRCNKSFMLDLENYSIEEFLFKVRKSTEEWDEFDYMYDCWIINHMGELVKKEDISTEEALRLANIESVCAFLKEEIMEHMKTGRNFVGSCRVFLIESLCG